MQYVRWGDAIKIAINVTFISLLAFLMIEVIWAQALKDLIIDRGMIPSWFVLGLIFSGFFLSAIVSILAALLSSNATLRHFSYYAAGLAFLANMFLWCLVAYLGVLYTYPSVLSDLSFIEKFLALPNIIAYFSIYILSNVTLLWIISCVTYALLFALFVYLLARRKKTTKHYYKKFEL